MSLVDRIRNRKGTGWQPDAPDSRDYVYARDLGELPASVNLSEFEPPIWDQEHTSSCVAQAVIAAVMMSHARTGKPVGTLSRLYAYWTSRRAHRAAWIDAGTSIRIMAKMIQKIGVCSEIVWPWNPSRVNKKPNWKAFTNSAPFWDTNYFRIDTEGAERVKDIKQALADGHAVVWGTRVPTDWVRGESPKTCTGPWNYSKFAGGHAMVLTGYEDNGISTWFDCRNSWGKNWGDAGNVALHEDWIKWENSRDFTVFVCC